MFLLINAWKMMDLCMGQSHVRAVTHAGLMVWHWYALVHKCIQALEGSMNEQQPLVQQ